MPCCRRLFSPFLGGVLWTGAFQCFRFIAVLVFLFGPLSTSVRDAVDGLPSIEVDASSLGLKILPVGFTSGPLPNTPNSRDILTQYPNSTVAARSSVLQSSVSGMALNSLEACSTRKSDSEIDLVGRCDDSGIGCAEHCQCGCLQYCYAKRNGKTNVGVCELAPWVIVAASVVIVMCSCLMLTISRCLLDRRAHYASADQPCEK